MAAMATTEHPNARRARLARDNAGRQREYRARLRASGQPDPRIVDAVIVDALRETLAQDQALERIKAAGSLTGIHVRLSAVLSRAVDVLVEGRGVEIPMARRVVREALLPTPRHARPAHTPSPTP